MVGAAKLRLKTEVMTHSFHFGVIPVFLQYNILPWGISKSFLGQYRILNNSHFNLPKSTAKHRLFGHQEEKM